MRDKHFICTYLHSCLFLVFALTVVNDRSRPNAVPDDDDDCCGRPLLLSERRATALMNEPPSAATRASVAWKCWVVTLTPAAWGQSHVLNETSSNKDKWSPGILLPLLEISPLPRRVRHPQQHQPWHSDGNHLLKASRQSDCLTDFDLLALEIHNSF